MRALRAVAVGLSIGLLALVGGLAVMLIVVPKVAGAVPLTVLTSSMSPRLPAGTLVVVRPVRDVDLHVGEVATYQIASGRPEVVTHRVVAITTTSDGQRRFVFRGDANAVDDAEPVRPEQVRGVLWYSLPAVGRVEGLIDGPGRVWAIPAAAGGLFAYAAVMVGLGTRDAGRRRVAARRRETWLRR